MSKFFIPKANIFPNKIVISGEDVKHITKVLRLGVGDTVVCCDGAGNDYTTVISSVGDTLECTISEKRHAETEADIHVILIQGIPKSSKMDYIIQKTTELGIFEIYPCEMARCVSKPENGKKTARWQKIAREAAKQSGRGIVPIVHDSISIREASEILKSADVSFVPYECAEDSFLKPLLKNTDSPKTIAFMIGPEGGFDKEEIEFLTEANVPTVSLGKRILRTETAGEAVLAMVMYELGDINA